MNTRLTLLAVLSVTLAACASQPSSNYGRSYPSSAPYNEPIRCNDCGRVERIETAYGTRDNTGTGAVLGGIVGGVLGNQVGKGDGRKAATVAGAVGGAVAGNAIEKNRSGQIYNITVRMDDGRRLVIGQNTISDDLRNGSPVRVINGRVVPLR